MRLKLKATKPDNLMVTNAAFFSFAINYLMNCSSFLETNDVLAYSCSGANFGVYIDELLKDDGLFFRTAKIGNRSS